MAFATRKQDAMNLDPKHRIDVYNIIKAFDDRFVIAPEPHSVGRRLAELLLTHALGGKQVHDANIVATMLVYSIPTLLTFNTADFLRFEPLISIRTPQAVMEPPISE